MSLRDLETEFSLLREWLFDSALPLWAGRGADPAVILPMVKGLHK